MAVVLPRHANLFNFETIFFSTTSDARPCICWSSFLPAKTTFPVSPAIPTTERSCELQIRHVHTKPWCPGRLVEVAKQNRFVLNLISIWGLRRFVKIARYIHIVLLELRCWSWGFLILYHEKKNTNYCLRLSSDFWEFDCWLVLKPLKTIVNFFTFWYSCLSIATEL